MRGRIQLLCFLFPLVCCTPGHNVTEKPWTLPINETSITTDLLSGQVVSTQENVYRYDKLNRPVYQSHTTNGVLQSENTDFIYDGRKQTYRQSLYKDGQAHESCRIEVLYADDSLLRRSRLNLSFETNTADNIMLEYTYDAENRPVELVCSNADTIHSIQKTVYQTRQVRQTKTEYSNGTWHSIRSTDITYADDVFSMPLTEQYSCVFKWDTLQKYTTTTTCEYNRQGYLSGKKVWENGVHKTTCGEYRYSDKQLVYTSTDYGDGKPLRTTQTTIRYK